MDKNPLTYKKCSSYQKNSGLIKIKTILQVRSNNIQFIFKSVKGIWRLP